MTNTLESQLLLGEMSNNSVNRVANDSQNYGGSLVKDYTPDVRNVKGSTQNLAISKKYTSMT